MASLIYTNVQTQGVAPEDLDKNGVVKPYTRSRLVKDAIFIPQTWSTDVCDGCLFVSESSNDSGGNCAKHHCSGGKWGTPIEAAMHKLENA